MLVLPFRDPSPTQSVGPLLLPQTFDCYPYPRRIVAVMSDYEDDDHDPFAIDTSMTALGDELGGDLAGASLGDELLADDEDNGLDGLEQANAAADEEDEESRDTSLTGPQHRSVDQDAGLDERTHAAHTETLAATLPFLGRLSGFGDQDDTEALTSAVSRATQSTTDAVKTRENQVRELSEINRLLDSSAISDEVLSQVLEDVELFELEAIGRVDAGASYNGMPHQDSLYQVAEESEHDDDLQSARRHSSSPFLLPPGPSRTAPLPQHFAHLQAIGSTLLTSLATLSEHTQISDGSIRDASRLLRRATANLHDLQADDKKTEDSRRQIEARRQRQAEELEGVRSARLKVDEELRDFAKMWDEADKKARRLLASRVKSDVLEGSTAVTEVGVAM